MNRRISVVRAGLTSAAGLVGLGVAGVVVLGLCVIPFPVLAGTTVSMTVDPTASTSVRVCPGPLLGVQTRDGDATSYVGTERPDITSGSTNDPVDETYVSVIDAANQNGTLAPAVLSVAPPADGSIALLAGTQSQTVLSDDMAGLAATPCVEPEAESWLVGGASDLGQTTVINLTNASITDASVHIDVFGEKGRVTPTGSNDVVVQAGTQKLVGLASIAPDLYAPVVHVSSSGGSLATSLQQVLVRTILPSGVEIIEPGAAPNTTQIMTGVRLVGMAQFSDSEGGAVTSEQEPTVRVLATTDAPSDVVVTTIAADGTTTEVKATAKPGVALQLPFNSIPDGTYTVIATGTTPIVAAVRTVVPVDVDPFDDAKSTATPGATSTATPTASPTPGASSSPTPTAKLQANMEGPLDGTGQLVAPAPGATAPPGQAVGASSNVTAVVGGGDFAWYASTSELTDATLVPIANAPGAQLTVFNGSPVVASLTLSSNDDSDRTVELQPGSTSTLVVKPGHLYRLDGATAMRAGVTYGGRGIASAATVRAPSKLGSAILVYPR